MTKWIICSGLSNHFIPLFLMMFLYNGIEYISIDSLENNIINLPSCAIHSNRASQPDKNINKFTVFM